MRYESQNPSGRCAAREVEDIDKDPLLVYWLDPIIVMYVPGQTMTGWTETMQ